MILYYIKTGYLCYYIKKVKTQENETRWGKMYLEYYFKSGK